MKLTEKTRQGSPGFMHYDELDGELWRVNWKQQGYPYCGIYAIAPDNRWPTKIGISQNPVRRLISLQGAHWKKLDVSEYRYAESFSFARKVEARAHQMLHEDGKTLQGEWFDIRPEQAIEVVEFAAQLLGIELNSKIPTEEIRKALVGYAQKANRVADEIMHDNIDARLYGT